MWPSIKAMPTWLRAQWAFYQDPAVQCKTLGIVHGTVVGQNSISSRANLPVVTAESVILDSIARRASSIRCHPPQIASHMLCIKEIISSRKF